MRLIAETPAASVAGRGAVLDAGNPLLVERTARSARARLRMTRSWKTISPAKATAGASNQSPETGRPLKASTASAIAATNTARRARRPPRRPGQRATAALRGRDDGRRRQAAARRGAHRGRLAPPLPQVQETPHPSLSPGGARANTSVLPPRSPDRAPPKAGPSGPLAPVPQERAG